MSEVQCLKCRRRIILWTIILFFSVAPNPLWARGGGGCFFPDSPILKANGRESPISDLRTGDELLAFTPEGRLAHARVHEIVRQEVKAYVLLKTDQTMLRVTAEHPFYVGNGMFKTLEVLKEGDSLFTWDGQRLMEQRIISLQEVHRRAQVYNLKTDHPNTFFAGRIAVHNKGGGCFPPGTLIRTPKGQIPIEKLSTGDIVLALDPEAKVVHTRIEAIFNTLSPVLWVDTDRGSLRTTVDHPIGLPSGGFIPAGQLRSGQEVLLWREGSLQTATILRTSLDTINQQVHNLRVGWPHTFLAADIVTHNKGGSSGRSSSSRSSSGFRSSSGSSSSSSDGGAIAAIITIGVFILIVVILISVAKRSNSQKSENLDFVYDRKKISPKAGKTEKLLIFVSQQDPSVSPEALRKLAESTFRKLQECWQARDYPYNDTYDFISAMASLRFRCER